MVSLQQENERLRKQLEIQVDLKVAEEKEQLRIKNAELELLKSTIAKVTQQINEEVTRRKALEATAKSMAQKCSTYSLDLDLGEKREEDGEKIRTWTMESMQDEEDAELSSKNQTSLKLMRIVESWISAKDLQEALLRNAGINDTAFTAVVSVLKECQSLALLDLGQNQLTMDSCVDVCNIITSAPKLAFVSVAENHFSLRSVGYFMSAIMERQQKKTFVALNAFDMENVEGLVAARTAPRSPQGEKLMEQLSDAFGTGRLPAFGAAVLANVSKALWRFLHFTDHPQVQGKSEEDVAFKVMHASTLRKMERALCRILLIGDDNDDGVSVHANFVLLPVLESSNLLSVDMASIENATSVTLSRGVSGGTSAGAGSPPVSGSRNETASVASASKGRAQTAPEGAQRVRMQKEFPEFRDPFLELRKPFVTPKEKLKTFNLKQIVTKGGQVLMNMLERLLETTEIDAKDVETEVTLMEHACQTCNLQLAKLCYRRGANLAALTKRGSSYFNIATQNKNYPLMEFLCMYGGAAKVPMKVNHQDAEGRTALHVAAGNDDVDSICRLIEWGIDVNLHDYKKRTPLHTAARNGHYDATMLLLEVGADLNAKDEKEYTAVAHAEARNHFALMDRLVSLGGTGHGLSASKGIATNAQPPKKLGELAVTAMMLRSSSLGRLGKVQVKGMPGMLQSRPHTRA